MKTLREVALEAIEKAAEDMREQNPTLTKPEAIAKAASKNRELYALYSGPEADLPIEQAAANLRLEANLAGLGFMSAGHAVTEAAKAASPHDIQRGLALVEKHLPNLWACYRSER